MYLKGFQTFEAASTVAAMCAHKRQQRRHTQSGGVEPSKQSSDLLVGRGNHQQPSSSSSSGTPTPTPITNVQPRGAVAVGSQLRSPLGAPHLNEPSTRSTSSSPGTYPSERSRDSSGGVARPAAPWRRRAQAVGSSLAVPGVASSDDSGELTSPDVRAAARQVLMQLSPAAGPEGQRDSSGLVSPSVAKRSEGGSSEFFSQVKKFFSFKF